MPSTVMIPVSGIGISLVPPGSGNLYSGGWGRIVGGIRVRYDVSGPNIVYLQVGPNLSGDLITITSGTSGLPALTDGFPMLPGDSYFIPKQRLCSGLETPRFAVPAAASGGFMFWEPELGR